MVSRQQGPGEENSRNRRQDRSLPDPRKVYIHGTRFLFTEHHLRQTIPAGGHASEWAAMPAMIISAFSAELFLKTILLLEEQRPPDVHHLGTLFKRIKSHKTKRRIEKLWDASVAAHAADFEKNEKILGFPIPRDLRTALHDCGDAFKTMRYAYEDFSKVKFYIGELAKIVQLVILEIRPDWK
jgi:hypothetical protein